MVKMAWFQQGQSCSQKGSVPHHCPAHGFFWIFRVARSAIFAWNLLQHIAWASSGWASSPTQLKEIRSKNFSQDKHYSLQTQKCLHNKKTFYRPFASFWRLIRFQSSPIKKTRKKVHTVSSRSEIHPQEINIEIQNILWIHQGTI